MVLFNVFRRKIRCFAPTISACLGSITLGCTLGYTAPAIPEINTNRNPFYMNNMDVSLVTSLASIGGMLGGPIGGVLLDNYGRQCTLMVLNLFSAIGWAIVIASTNVFWMCAGRFLTGFCGGIVDVAVSVYIAETVAPRVRGRMGTCQSLSYSVGVLLVYTFSFFLRWNWLAVACQTVSVIMVASMFFMVESPRWLLTKGFSGGAKEALQWLRDQNDVSEELTEIELNVKESASSKVTWQDFLEPGVYKPLLIIVGLFFIQQFSGCGIIPAYMVAIFQASGVTWNSQVQIVVVQAVGLAAIILSAIVVDRFGRRMMLCISAAIMTVGLGGLAIFFQLKYLMVDFDVARFSWLPISCLILYNIGMFLGYAPIPFYLASELFPLKTRGTALGIGILCIWIFTFISTLAYPHLVILIHDQGVFWIFAAVALVGFVFPIVLVPETKGKSLEEIEMHFKYK